MAGGWGCPHEIDDCCEKFPDGRACNPGMKGCVLAGRWVFANDEKNTRLNQKKSKNEAGEHSNPADELRPPPYSIDN